MEVAVARGTDPVAGCAGPSGSGAWRRWAALLAALSAVALAAACGSGGAAATASPGSTRAGAYLSCLREHGVTVPSGGPRGHGGRAGGRPSGRPSGRPTGRRPSGMPSGDPGGRGFGPRPSGAATACASLRPSPGVFGGGRVAGGTALKAFRSCLSDHGVTGTADPRALRAATGKRGAAYRTCRALLPSRSPAPSR